jgi:hypothetical protein
MSNNSIPLADLVRMPVGISTIYVLGADEMHTFIKKLSTYSKRSGCEVDYDVYDCISRKHDRVIRMAICKVVKQGAKRKRKRSMV